MSDDPTRDRAARRPSAGPEEVYERYLEGLRREPSILLDHVCAMHPELKSELRKLDEQYRRARALLEELGLPGGEEDPPTAARFTGP